MNNNYVTDEKKLLEFFVSSYYLPNAFNNKKNAEWKFTAPIELIIRPQCNQKCEYCYITQHGDELYPKDKRPNNEILLKNIGIILNFIIDNKLFVQRYEIFAGDLFYDGLYYEIIDKFYEAYSKIPQEIQQDLKKKFGFSEIVLPTNGAFFIKEENKQKMRQYTEKMKKIGFILGISWSTDGLHAAETREEASKKDYKIQQEYYDNLFPFMKEMAYGYHPMIAPENVNTAIDNFDWWISQFEKYDIADRDAGKYYPTFLEVRNDYWTDEQIINLTKLIRHIWDKKLQLNHDSMQHLARHLFLGDGNDGSLPRLAFYDLCELRPASEEDEAILGCHMQTLFRINVADMSLPTCHRLTYPQFTGGYFEIQNEKIIGLTPTSGTSSWIELRLLMPKYYLKCANCEYNMVCLHGCLGAQYESSGEILEPAESVCKMLKAKYDVLLELYNSSGIIRSGIESGYLKNGPFKEWLINMSKKKGYLDERFSDFIEKR